MKIGILTYYYKSHNCGGLLQAYALVRFLSEYGYDVEQICFKPSNPFAGEKAFSKIRRHLRNDGFGDTISLVFRELADRLFARGNSDSEKDFISSFEEFERDIPHSLKVYDENDIADVISNYDAFIAGSDQIWSWVFNTMERGNGTRDTRVLDAYMLRFVPEYIYKLSYAASISCPNIPNTLSRYYEESIMRLDAASIREEASLALFSEEVRKRISVVLDPTLLLTREKWCDDLKLGNRTIDKPYLFLYLLGTEKENRRILKSVKAISERFGLPILTNPGTRNGRGKSYLAGFADFEDYWMGPREFVQHVRDAALVITNSFHATVFSLNFHTPFYVLKRDGKVSMHSRIESVIYDFGIASRVLGRDFDISALNLDDVDWRHIDEVMDDKRSFSRDFLVNGLEARNYAHQSS